MKWIKVFRIYYVSEDGLLKVPKSDFGYPVFDGYYYSEDEAIRDIKQKSDGDLIYQFPDQVLVLPCMVKALE